MYVQHLCKGQYFKFILFDLQGQFQFKVVFKLEVLIINKSSLYTTRFY